MQIAKKGEYSCIVDKFGESKAFNRERLFNHTK